MGSSPKMKEKTFTRGGLRVQHHSTQYSELLTSTFSIGCSLFRLSKKSLPGRIVIILENLKRPKVIKGQIERQMRKEGRLKALPESGYPVKSLSSHSFHSHSDISRGTVQNHFSSQCYKCKEGHGKSGQYQRLQTWLRLSFHVRINSEK